MIRALGVVAALAACSSKPTNQDSVTDCGVKVRVAYLGENDLAFCFENVSSNTVTIGGAGMSMFSDANGTMLDREMQPGNDVSWHMPINLMPGTHAFKTLTFSSGEPRHLRKARIVLVRPRCTIKLDFTSDIQAATDGSSS